MPKALHEVLEIPDLVDPNVYTGKNPILKQEVEVVRLAFVDIDRLVIGSVNSGC